MDRSPATPLNSLLHKVPGDGLLRVADGVVRVRHVDRAVAAVQESRLAGVALVRLIPVVRARGRLNRNSSVPYIICIVRNSNNTVQFK